MFSAIGRAVQAHDDGSFAAHVEILDAAERTVQFADYLATSLDELRTQIGVTLAALHAGKGKPPGGTVQPPPPDTIGPTREEREATLAAAIVGAELGAV